MLRAARDAIAESGWGAGASPLLSGHSSLHRRLEQQLAELERTERAVVFGSGFAANVGTVAALVGPGDAIFSDANNHASLIDGCRLSRANVHIYRHTDAGHLAELLAAHGTAGRRLIVTDSLFSMDGVFAPLAELVELADEFDAMLLIDEAHATGVLGTRGSGLVEALGLEGRVDVRAGTLSKALGSCGGFVSGTEALAEWVTNAARPYVFSTAMPAAAAAAALAALDVVRTEPERRETLARRAGDLRERLRAEGFALGRSESHIITLLAGEANDAVALAAELAEQGFYVPAIRPPSVAPGTSRLRISLVHDHSPEMIDRLVAALVGLRTRSTATVGQTQAAPI